MKFSPSLPFSLASQSGTLQLNSTVTQAQNYTLMIELLNGEVVSAESFLVVPGIFGRL
jgi:hypothetical protein